ncbi:MAG: DUF3592 domain-containing protein [Gammaproteobacteria bacterium]|nr:DUF3592 domain-containing protein [Gammaproteobacteria bacterium]
MSFLVGVMIIAGGLIVVVGEIYATRELKRIRSWPETEGTIEKFAVTATYVGDYFPGISYRYEVDGREYVGDVIRRGGRVSFRSRRRAREMEQYYVPGGRIPVYYDPDAPDQCCIDRDETAGGRSAMFWGVAMVLLGGFVLFQAFTH